jgi:uncharacterized protein
MMRRGARTSRHAFVDTSAYFAVANERDASQEIVATIVRELVRERWRTTTTNFILAETHALLLTRLNRVVALKVVEAIERSDTVIERVRVEDERRAWEIIRQYDDKNFSFTDATSFAVMERLAITHAFTLDRNFAQYGLTILTRDQFGER